MWHLTARKTAVSISFLNWIKSEMTLMLATLIPRYNKKSFQEQEIN